MRFLTLLSALPLLASTATAFETLDDAAKQAAAKLFDPQVFGVGTFASKYPDEHPVQELRAAVVASPDYFAPCFDNGDLLMLAMPVSQHWHNALVSPTRNATFSIGSNPDPSVPDPRHTSRHGRWNSERPDWRKGMPSKNRMTLFGHVEDLKAGSADEEEESTDSLAKCFLSYHPDSKHWAPGAQDSPHQAFWVRFVVDKLYHVGGFGDEHAIGFIPLNKYASAVAKEARQQTAFRGRHPQKVGHGLGAETLFGQNIDLGAEDREAQLQIQG